MAAQRKKSTINLLPQSEFDDTTWGKILQWILTTFRLIVITVELVVIVGFLSRFYLDLKNSELDDEIEQKAALIESYLPFEKEFKYTQKTISLFDTLTSIESPHSNTFSKVVKRLPIDVSLINVTKTYQSVEILGSSLSEQSIAQFIANLNGDPEFEGVALVQIQSRAESPLITFTLKTPEKQIKVEGQGSQEVQNGS